MYFNISQTVVQHNKQVRAKVPENLVPLMGPHFEKVDDMLSPGLTLLNWSSLNLELFANSVTASLDSLELLVDRAKDILEIRIQGVLQEISSTLICSLPDSEPWTIEEFVSKIQVNIAMNSHQSGTLFMRSFSHPTM